MNMIQVPILFPEPIYNAMKIKSIMEQKPMASFIREVVKKELGKVSYRSPLFEMTKKASGSLRAPKKNYSLSVDKVVYGSDNRR